MAPELDEKLLRIGKFGLFLSVNGCTIGPVKPKFTEVIAMHKSNHWSVRLLILILALVLLSACSAPTTVAPTATAPSYAAVLATLSQMR